MSTALDNPQVTERRRQPRASAPAPALNLQLDALVKPLVAGLSHPWRGLFLLTCLSAASIFWVWWTIEDRLQTLAAYDAAVGKEFALQDAVLRLQENHYTKKIETAERELAVAADHILPDYAALAAWLQIAARRADEHGLKLAYKLSDSEPVPGEQFVRQLPIEITVSLAENQTSTSSYHQLLKYLRYLDDQNWTKELRRAVMHADSGQVQRLVLNLVLWLHSDAKPRSAPAATGPPLVSDSYGR